MIMQGIKRTFTFIMAVFVALYCCLSCGEVKKTKLTPKQQLIGSWKAILGGYGKTEQTASADPDSPTHYTQYQKETGFYTLTLTFKEDGTFVANPGVETANTKPQINTNLLSAKNTAYTVKYTSTTSYSTTAAPITYTFICTNNGDGTATITATLPEGIGAGRIDVKTSSNLSYINGSVTSPIGGTVNALNVKENGIIVSFASATTYDTGAVVMTADYTIAEGAAISASDIIVDNWRISDGTVSLCDQDDGDVIKLYEYKEVAESSEESFYESSAEKDETEEDKAEDLSEGQEDHDRPAAVGITPYDLNHWKIENGYLVLTGSVTDAGDVYEETFKYEFAIDGDELSITPIYARITKNSVIEDEETDFTDVNTGKPVSLIFTRID